MDSLQSAPDQNRGPGEMALIVVLTVTSTILVTIRLYSKIFVLRTMGWDDGMMVVALILSILFMAANIVTIKYGYGRHKDALTSHQIKQIYKYLFIATIVNNLILFFVKWSVLLFLLRVNKLKRWVEMVIYLTLFLVLSSLAAATIVQFIQCQPISRSWDYTMNGNCLSTQVLLKAYTVTLAFPAATDIICAILPFFILWDLQINKKTKVSIWILICFGLFPGVCSLVRTSLYKDNALLDFTWSTVPYRLWSIAEIHSGIIAATIPTLRAPVLRVATRLRGAPKVSSSIFELRNPYRCRVRNQHEYDDGTNLIPSHEISNPTNQSWTILASDLEVANTTNQEPEVRPENASEGGVRIVGSVSEGQ